MINSKTEAQKHNPLGFETCEQCGNYFVGVKCAECEETITISKEAYDCAVRALKRELISAEQSYNESNLACALRNALKELGEEA